MEKTLFQIKEECDFKNVPEFIRYLKGGDTNQVFLIKADYQKWVVKQNNAMKFPQMFEKEYRAMQFLSSKSPLYYPQMRNYFSKGNKQFLIVEYVEEGKNTSRAQQNFGKLLAQQHQISSTSFGWQEDNYIGSLKQINSKNDSWNSFLAENRFLFQAKIAFDKGFLSSKDIQQLERLCHHLNEIIPEEKPALLHGDLWGGNYFISMQDKPVLYDPAVYFGHREIEVAMTMLFGGFSNEFYSAYQAEYPLEKDWKKRVELFQLYPNLVHLNLFGNSYLESVKSVIRSF